MYPPCEGDTGGGLPVFTFNFLLNKTCEIKQGRSCHKNER